MGCPPVRKIIHSLKLVDYLNVHADNPWYNYYLYDDTERDASWVAHNHIQQLNWLKNQPLVADVHNRYTHYRSSHYIFGPRHEKIHTGKAAIENINTIEEHRWKIVRKRVFDWHLSPDW